MSSPELEAGLKALAELIPETDRSILDDIDNTTDEGQQIRGYVVSHGEHNLAVYSVAESAFFTLQYQVNTIPGIVRKHVVRRYQEENGPIKGNVDIQITDEDQEAAQQWLQERIGDLGEQQVNELNRKCTQLLSDPSCAYQLQSHFGAPTGFTLRRKLFVYEDDFSASDFDQACQALVSVAQVPRQLLWQIYDVPEQNENTTQETEETQDPTDQPRGFQ